MTQMIYPNVQIGAGPQIGDYVVIGHPPRCREPGELITVIGAGAVIRSHTVIYAGNQIGINFVTGHGVVIQEENQIGSHVSIGTHCVIEHHVKIGDGVRMDSRAFIPAYSVLKEGCWIGPNVVFANRYDPLFPNRRGRSKGVIIERGAKIGANVTLLPDIKIGENVLVGAGAVVVENVPPGSIVASNPAWVIKDTSELPHPCGALVEAYAGSESDGHSARRSGAEPLEPKRPALMKI